MTDAGRVGDGPERQSCAAGVHDCLEEFTVGDLDGDLGVYEFPEGVYTLPAY